MRGSAKKHEVVGMRAVVRWQSCRLKRTKNTKLKILFRTPCPADNSITPDRVRVTPGLPHRLDVVSVCALKQLASADKRLADAHTHQCRASEEKGLPAAQDTRACRVEPRSGREKRSAAMPTHTGSTTSSSRPIVKTCDKTTNAKHRHEVCTTLGELLN